MRKRMSQSVFRLRQRGTTMFEILLVVMVIVAVMGFSIRQYSSIRSEQDSAATAMSLRVIATAARQGYASQENFAGITTVAVNALVPARSVLYDAANNGRFLAAQGAFITVQPVTLNGENNSGFELLVSNLDSGQCIAVIRQLEREFDEITVFQQVVKTGGLDGVLNMPFAIERCNRAPFTIIGFRSAG